MKQIIYIILIVITVVAVYYGIKTHLYAEGEVVSDDFDVTDDIKKLDIDAAMMDVTIEQGDEVKVEYKGDDRLKPTFEFDKDSGTLKIKQKKKANINVKNLNYESKLRIELPKNHNMEEFEMDLDMGNLIIDEINAKEISIEDNMGNVEIEKTTSESIKVEANMGNVVISKCATTNVEINASMGNVEIKLEDDVKDYTINANTSLGNLTIGSDKHKGNFKQTGTKGTIKVDCNLGDVEIR